MDMLITLILIVACCFQIWFFYQSVKMWKEMRKTERKWEETTERLRAMRFHFPTEY